MRARGPGAPPRGFEGGTLFAFSASDHSAYQTGPAQLNSMRLAFLDLPDDRVDLISTARGAAGVELVLVASADPEALSLRIAEVLQIPRSTEPLDLLALKPDRVALPSLESPGAAALLRAGISPNIFLPLPDLQAILNGGPAERATDPTPAPIDEWEREF